MKTTVSNEPLYNIEIVSNKHSVYSITQDKGGRARATIVIGSRRALHDLRAAIDAVLAEPDMPDIGSCTCVHGPSGLHTHTRTVAAVDAESMAVRLNGDSSWFCWNAERKRFEYELVPDIYLVHPTGRHYG